MSTFEDFKICDPIRNAIADMGLLRPTPIQKEAFSTIMSGQDVVGIAQTGTGKTFAYLIPILQSLTFSKEIHPRVLVMVPTRELVVQVVAEIEKLAKYSNVRVSGVYGGTSMKRNTEALSIGSDIVVATPGRLYDLVLTRALQLKLVKKLVIDEVDVMLDLGFRFQLTNIFELLPERRQNIMFSATMTEEIDALIQDFFIGARKISIAVSGTPLDTISQNAYAVPNFYTKANLLIDLLQDPDEYRKVLVFVSNKKSADRLFAVLDEFFGEELCVIHSNKTQNYRERSIKQFDAGKNRILVTTDVMSRGLDLEEISHVVNFDTPAFPENYMHRIGRTGRAGKTGTSLLFYTDKETEAKEAIEKLMDYQIPSRTMSSAVEIATLLTPDERPKIIEANNPHTQPADLEPGASFHEKSKKNKKQNLGGSYKRIIKEKYQKPKTRGDKNFNKKNKRK